MNEIGSIHSFDRDGSGGVGIQHRASNIGEILVGQHTVICLYRIVSNVGISHSPSRLGKGNDQILLENKLIRILLRRSQYRIGQEQSHLIQIIQVEIARHLAIRIIPSIAIRDACVAEVDLQTQEMIRRTPSISVQTDSLIIVDAEHVPQPKSLELPLEVLPQVGPVLQVTQ